MDAQLAGVTAPAETVEPVVDDDGTREPIRLPAPDDAGRSAATAALPATFVLALASVVGAVVGAATDTETLSVSAAIVVVTWAAASVIVARRSPRDPGLGLSIGLVAAVGAVAVIGGPAWFGLVIAALTHLALGLPGGRLVAVSRRVLVAIAVAGGVAITAVSASGEETPTTLLLAMGAVATAISFGMFVERCRGASVLDRARLQWVGWAVLVLGTLTGGVGVLSLLLSWPPDPASCVVVMSLVVPFALVATTSQRLLNAVDAILVKTIGTAGVVALVGAVYVVVVIGLGRSPSHDERPLLGLSIAAAAIGAALAFPARLRLEAYANERVYGDRHAPDETLRTFAGRMSRAVPMDELQLQLVESLRKTMALHHAELWTGVGGVLDRTTSVPDRGPGRIVLQGNELTVVARAHVTGAAWLQVWIPALLEGRTGGPIRVASVAHLGELLGLIVVERPVDGAAFTESEDQVLADLARQLGLALHNVRLDSALQASLEELEARNVDLQASRLRIVTASDESRRRIERNLHDGAQQHLVALAVKIGLVRQLLDSDRATAEAMLEELRTDVQATLQELRELAHGIYPPLLRDRGLFEALRTAANRSTLHTEIEADGLDRYPAEVEAAVYFCCLEALQNAGKYAGEDAEVTIRVTEEAGAPGEMTGAAAGKDGGVLRFSVHDTGPGFDTAGFTEGHGFTNMRDRLGAIGGDVRLVSAPGEGTTVEGSIPLGPVAEPAETATDS